MSRSSSVAMEWNARNTTELDDDGMAPYDMTKSNRLQKVYSVIYGGNVGLDSMGAHLTFSVTYGGNVGLDSMCVQLTFM